MLDNDSQLLLCPFTARFEMTKSYTSRKTLSLTFCLFVLLCFLADVCAKEKLTWGGFVFVGGDVDRTNEKSGEFIQENFPQTWKIVETSREEGGKPSKIDSYLLKNFPHN